MSTVTSVQMIQDLTSFGVFVGLYNKLNNTSFSVKQALSNPELTTLFAATAQTLQSNTITTSVKNQVKSSKSTKRFSYEAFQTEHGTTAAHAIYSYCKTQNKSLSRAEIADGLNMRLSTVCGQVFNLIEAGLLVVDGTKVDEKTGREVETVFYR